MTTKTDSSRASKAIKRLKDEVLHIQIHDFLEEIYSNGQKIKFHSSFSVFIFTNIHNFHRSFENLYEKIREMKLFLNN